MTNGERLDIDAIRRVLPTRILGQSLAYFQSIGSTNDAAKHLAASGESEGAIVLADFQSAGRGRLARSWVAPACSSVLMSIILKPALQPNQIARVTIAASLGMCAALEQVTNLKPQIKWPNDILVNGKKCAGILAESVMGANLADYVIVGLGINVNFSAADAALAELATTLSDELGREISREGLIVALLREIERYYTRLGAGQDLGVEWKSRLATLGKRVSVSEGDRVVDGIAQDVDADGALLVQKADGEIERVIAGDATLRV